MDINYLLHRQQVETMRADGAACNCSRAIHQQMADLYIQHIQRVGSYRQRRAIAR